MQVSDLDAINAATLAAIRDGRAVADPGAFPFIGFYNVELFDCPPFVMFTADDCPRAHNILYQREFEPMSMQIWCKLARTATGIVDLGAHVGVYSLAAAALRPELKIQAFEPNPYAYTRLRLHKTINGFQNLVDHPYGVARKETMVKFSWRLKGKHMISSGASIGHYGPETPQQTLITQMICLDDTDFHTRMGARPLIKMDIEGSEDHAIDGMTKIFALKPDLLYETNLQKAADKLTPMMQALGYSFYLVREKQRQLVQRDRIYKSDLEAGDLNQFLTVRPRGEIAAMFNVVAA